MDRRQGYVIGLNAEENYIRLIRLTVWAYFLLLVFEGALRKWVMPQAAMLLFAIRAPLVLSAYVLALRVGKFPWNLFTSSLALLGVASFFAGWMAEGNTLFVALVGAQSNFLHIPFIFLIAMVMNREDVRKFGYLIMILALPMAILMVFQFQAGPFSFINYGAGGDEGVQALSAVGKIRPSGTFAFNTGVACYYGAVAAFMIYGMFIPGKFPWWLNMMAGISIVTATAVSGNRTLVASFAIVIVCALLSAIWQPKLLFRFFKVIGFTALVLLLASMVPVVQEGFEVLFERFYLASMSEGGAGGTAGRFMLAFTHPWELFFDVPLFGHGLGMGTNAGAQLLTGGRTFLLLVEGEWDRIIMESGPILGTAFILWRTVLVAYLGIRSLMSAVQSNVLPLLMWSVSATLLWFGQFGPATNLGFAVFLGGMCLASMNEAPEELNHPEMEEEDEEEIATGAHQSSVRWKGSRRRWA